MIGRRACWLTGCLVALATAGTAAATAGAYRITLAPKTVPAGGQSILRATIHATTSTIRSVNLRPPDGYGVSAVTAPRGASGSITRNLVRLRGLQIAPGTSKTVTLTLDAPCSSRTRRPWSTLPRPARGATTATTGACSLSFVPQPANAKVGQRVSAASFDTAGPAPAVAVIDARGGRSRSDGVKVALTLAPGSAAGPLTGGRRRSSKGGVVAFPRLTVASQGPYRLLASAKRVPPATSDAFQAEQDVAVCPDNVGCSTTATTTGTFGPNATPYAVSLNVQAPDNPNLGPDGGALTTSFDTQPPLDCRGYAELSPATGVFLGPNREKIVRLTLSPSLVGANGLQACVGLPYNFIARLFTRIPVEEDLNGDGVTDQYVGLLNDCFDIALGLLITPPCVADRGQDANLNYYITIRLPANGADPRYRS